MSDGDGKWVPFWFESNNFFQTIESVEGWEELRKAYPEMSDAELLKAEEATYQGSRSVEERKSHPKYGFRIECDGEPLSAFFDRHGMEKPDEKSLRECEPQTV